LTYSIFLSLFKIDFNVEFSYFNFSFFFILILENLFRNKMNDRPPSYSFHQNFESSSAAIPTISGGTEAYNRRNPSGARKQVGDDTKAKSKRPIESDPHLCTDFLYLIRSNQNLKTE
jgi:hypothetical protein